MDGLADNFNGVARVTREGTVIRDVSGGMATPSVACGPEIRFQLASVSKAFTAAAVMLLHDAGKMSVADPITRWLNRSPRSWEDITVHHLLAHTAGLLHWHDLPAINLTEYMAPEDELEIIRQSPLRSAPGASWYYSSPGYVLLAHIVQQAADQPYHEFLDQRIFQPLELTETFAGNAGDRPRVAAGHVHGKPVRSFELDTVGMGAGDVWSTVDDVMHWSQALFDTAFLSNGSRRAMFDTQATLPSDAHLEDRSPITAQRYGYGWFLGKGLGKALVLHPGDNAGFKALNLFVPSSAVRLVVLVNDETSAFDAVAVELLTKALRPE